MFRTIHRRYLAGLTFSVLLIAGAACNSSQKKSAEETNIPSTEPSKASAKNYDSGIIYEKELSPDNQFSYAIYLPSSGKNISKSCLIFFDPHGDGLYPVKRYRWLADKFGVILIGSYDLKNGMDMQQSVSVAQRLRESVQTNFKLEPSSVSVAGFSGGAKVALASSGNTSSGTVIYCGAAFLPNTIPSLPPSLGIFGLADMNYSEVIDFGNSIAHGNMQHALLQWNGKHEWPDSSTFQYAFYWHEFHLPDSGSTELEKDWNVFLADRKKALTKSESALGKAMILRQEIAFAGTHQFPGEPVLALQQLLASNEFRNDSVRFTKSLEAERSEKQNYLSAFEQQNLNWWNLAIQKLKSGQDLKSKRLLAYVSLASYSYSNAALKNQDWTSLEKILEIYRLADPKNPDLAYITACMYARQGKKDAAFLELRNAVSYGMHDRAKLESDENLAGLRGSNEYQEILFQVSN